MEEIYKPEDFNATEQVDLKEYFDEFATCYYSLVRKEIVSEENTDNNTSLLMQEMGIAISSEDMSTLKEHCSIEKLKLSGEPKNFPIDIPKEVTRMTQFEKFYPINAQARTLETAKCKEVLDNKFEISDFLQRGRREFPQKIDAGGICNDIPIASNYILKILVYRPFSVFIGRRNSSENMRFKFEIEVLGSNTLLDIAKSISCITNEAQIKEVENTKVDLSEFVNAQEKYPSSLIFINNVFYNDLNHPNAIDYSANIIEWAKEKKIGNFKTNTMNVKLNTIKFRLGYPYVYIHQGNCEHLFTFCDARLIQESDILNSTKYPRITDSSRELSVQCYICCSTNAKWLVIGSDRFLQEKSFVCTECCDSYLFLDGKKIGEFKLFPYYDMELLTRHLDEYCDYEDT